MPEDCRRLLPDDTVLIRGIRGREINHQTGKIKKQAFIPRRNGKDDDGLSVSQSANDTLSKLKVRLNNEDGVFCELAAGEIRLIEEHQAELEVCPDPTGMDPYHALIIGVPVDPALAAIATRLAERLANISSIFIPTEI